MTASHIPTHQKAPNSGNLPHFQSQLLGSYALLGNSQRPKQLTDSNQPSCWISSFTLLDCVPDNKGKQAKYRVLVLTTSLLDADLDTYVRPLDDLAHDI